jgi:(E)-4-hydroxy-3-methylbut-2-enyl-diphosphate synthase
VAIAGGTFHRYPLLTAAEYASNQPQHPELNFVSVQLSDLTAALLDRLREDQTVVLWIDTDNEHAMPELRRAFFELIECGISAPVVIKRKFARIPDDQFQLYAATDCGGPAHRRTG